MLRPSGPWRQIKGEDARGRFKGRARRYGALEASYAVYADAVVFTQRFPDGATAVAARRRRPGVRVAGARAERATARRPDLRRPVHGDEPRNEVDRRWLGRERRLRRAVRALRRQEQRAGRLGRHGICSTLNGSLDENASAVAFGVLGIGDEHPQRLRRGDGAHFGL